MTATAKDVKQTATIAPIATQEQNKQDDSLFGMWSDKHDDVDTLIRNMRKSRQFE